ncbi:UNVERIFIED_ORG: oxygen-independent coproporphyrinogen-3 oxidase [Zoogloea ramigera]|uniref:STM4012 family radical SAM protein n=1 Tax=Duganella zoogloeoides TaxID=75659 RepID=A0ABZ0Y3I8_9BURK|nr:STM4012 family radical SAM protein [Duganella zoogloeoides]WQH06616.1 STM4012 family radical SAM protein [Duganella zoogloeoides]
MNTSEQPGTLAQRMRHTPYQAYSYSYPHKAAYRPLSQATPLAPLWAQQDRSALFAYIHIPFCEMRCGFCNLFAMARPGVDMVERYVQQVLVQMRAMDEVLGARSFARFALGGGTPTYLSAAQLDTLLCGARDILGIDLHATPAGIEASPETITAERLAVCRAHGIDRVSLGIQSFAAGEMRALARPQQNATVHHAIGLIRAAGFPTLNLDLIYGIAGQTVASLLASIDSALAFVPEEIYLYPLYVREQTGLGKVARRQGAQTLDPIMLASDGDSRLALYAAARDHLRARGYVQVSMRMFRAPHAPSDAGPSYCCQNDGMVGLGAGARSYTSQLHYSSEYAVARTETIGIIDNYLALDQARFAQAEHGYLLEVQDQQRRYVIQSLLTEPGLDGDAYTARFGTACEADLPQLAELFALELVERDGPLLRLNDQGYAYADTIGPWLASDTVRALMAESGQAC